MKRIAIIGDVTTTDGKIITGEQSMSCNNVSSALLGDKASCPKCDSIGTIIQGAANLVVYGKPTAYDGCIIACGCPIGTNRIIATKSTMFVDVATAKSSHTELSYTTQSHNVPSHTGRSHSVRSHDIVLNSDKTNIRQDAQKLLACAHKVCEKHLYHEDIKQEFINDAVEFTNKIIHDVDNSIVSYEAGSSQLKKEVKSLLKQSSDWLMNGLSTVGGTGMIMSGWGLCSTGLGCLIGAPLIAHGVNGIYEGSTGLYNGLANAVDGEDRPLNVDGPLREIYKKSASGLGFDQSVGSLAYDLVDIGISVQGKLKLVPKLDKFGNRRFKLFLYGRQDLERAYRQMNDKLLASEIFGDIISLANIYNELKAIFILNKETDQVSLVVRESEKIINVKEIVENCTLLTTITGNNDYDENIPLYYRCKLANGIQYDRGTRGNIIDYKTGQ